MLPVDQTLNGHYLLTKVFSNNRSTQRIKKVYRFRLSLPIVPQNKKKILTKIFAPRSNTTVENMPRVISLVLLCSLAFYVSSDQIVVGALQKIFPYAAVAKVKAVSGENSGNFGLKLNKNWWIMIFVKKTIKMSQIWVFLFTGKFPSKRPKNSEIWNPETLKTLISAKIGILPFQWPSG